jgi:hypothetical protein
MTAIEWLVDTIEKNRHKPIKELFVYIKQAKQMEADQIISAHESASLDAGYENSAREWAENYYKLKFKKK